MLRIIDESERWAAVKLSCNPAVHQRPNKKAYGISMQRLQRVSGGIWTVLCALIVLALWPVAAFHDEISFSPARFTEEWVKTMGLGILLFIAIESINWARTASAFRDSRAVLFDEPLRVVLHRVERFIASGDISGDELWEEWRICRSGYQQLLSLFRDVENARRMLPSAENMDLLGRKIASFLAPTNEMTAASALEIRDLISSAVAKRGSEE